MTADHLNKQLRIFYREVLPSLRDIVASDGTISNPHLISVPGEYTATRTRVMVIGQQTYGWGERGVSGQADALNALIQLYADFNLGEKYTASPFWQATVSLNRFVNPDSPPRAFLWSNLIKVDQSKRRPSQKIEEGVCALALLQREIAITKPNAVVFFTGPDYDSRIERSFPELTWESKSRLLTRLIHPNLPTLFFRTYHPNYLRRSGHWNVILKIGQEIIFRTHGS